MKASIITTCAILLLTFANNASALTNSALKSDAAKSFFKSGQKARQIKDIPCDNQQFINCLTLGDIQIGSKFDTLREKLGEPWHTFPRNDGSIDEVYPLRIYQHSTVYWVISHKNNRIVTVQLTGNRAPKTILFAGLQLGDHQDLIIDTLGYPEGRRRYGRTNAYIWDYRPLPFTLEIYNKRLYSVRIHHSNQPISTENISDTLLARLTGKDQTSVNHNKNLSISQITKPMESHNKEVNQRKGNFKNIITEVKNIAEQKASTAVKTVVNDTITQRAGLATDKEASEFISQETKDTIANFSDKTQQTIADKTDQITNDIKSAINAEFNPTQQEIIEAVEQWSEAWSQKDMPGYFSAYTRTYTPPSSASRSVWQDKREARITKKAWIKLTTSDFNFPKATITYNNQITVRFWLEYEVPGYKDKTLKSLTMVKTGNRWLIKQEQSLLVNKL